MGDETNERLGRLENDVADIKATLGRLEPVLMTILQGQARLEGRISDMPTARDFGRLEGRLEEMSRRMPTTIGYSPPRAAAE